MLACLGAFGDGAEVRPSIARPVFAAASPHQPRVKPSTRIFFLQVPAEKLARKNIRPHHEFAKSHRTLRESERRATAASRLPRPCAVGTFRQIPGQAPQRLAHVSACAVGVGGCRRVWPIMRKLSKLFLSNRGDLNGGLRLALPSQNKDTVATVDKLNVSVRTVSDCCDTSSPLVLTRAWHAAGNEATSR